MKRTLKLSLLAPALLVGGFALGSLTPHAQTAPQKIAFVDVSQVLKAHPDNAAVVALKAKADAELKPLSDQIQALQAQGSKISAADKDKLAQLSATISSKAKDYDNQIQVKVKPITEAVDTAVSTAAKANGVAVVMDAATAQGLVVFADPSTDLTDAVKTIVAKK
ncbi:OmpH family outer membrane protein [Deinococcus psychrotolerans]|uniref:OmpH family outer membrane protein n=1 Tax=Deinococcus psychrotolerans TaxID=2489213 RepID=A0A3G8YIF8_9DEIO|nr:OmpH family outer membrane protein [Deinococcus psychrotolerans]AZI42304.1 OmpH family outer membrane protein [Deinococcus psychrotolerans]